MNTSFQASFLHFEDMEKSFIVLSWKTSNSVSCILHAAQIPVGFTLVSSSTSFLISHANNATLSPVSPPGSEGSEEQPHAAPSSQ